ncbi:MAG: glutamate racemase [Nannocystaceae bacterium]|nr:glutamate racemase [Myxococcales bacterium]
MATDAVTSLPIGVFDSGVGGLTVLSALTAELPGESFLYLGDTARLPYGTKSAETVIRYAEQAAHVLIEQGVKFLVIACNTASAEALDHLTRSFAPVPVLGVVEPGARAACAASRSQRILVIATEGTVRSGAYPRAIREIAPAARVYQKACPLFVALAEEGWVTGPIAEAVARRYLEPALAEDPEIDCVVFGCTHFPVLAPAIARVVGPGITLVDSARTAAQAVAARLHRGGATAPDGAARGPRLMATDAPQRFARVGAVFLGAAIVEGAVELVDL